VLKDDSCDFQNEIPLPCFKSCEDTLFLLEVHVNYTVKYMSNT